MGIPVRDFCYAIAAHLEYCDVVRMDDTEAAEIQVAALDQRESLRDNWVLVVLDNGQTFSLEVRETTGE